MKTLTVYIKGSSYKFREIPKRYLHAIDKSNLLQVFERNPDTGEETLAAAFKDWEYFLVERD